ncbi:MAG TPA: hypothetical protein VE933_02865 [Chitinophagaceae bacterium]|nr:hypothetical protein [Chitinophagaceae bacterium]
MEATNFIEPLLERAEEYGKTSYELLKLKALNKTADVTSTLISRGAVVLALSIFIVLVNIGLSLWLGDVLGKSYYGFFCVSGFYAAIGFVLYFFLHEKIKKSISDSLITQMFN